MARRSTALQRPGLGRNGGDGRDDAARHRLPGRQRQPIRWGDYQKDVAVKQNVINANPDRLLLVRTAADIAKAKREKKFGVVLGTRTVRWSGRSSTGWRSSRRTG